MEFVITAALFTATLSVLAALRVYLPRLVASRCRRVAVPVTHLVRDGVGTITVAEWEALPVVAAPAAVPVPVETPVPVPVPVVLDPVPTVVVAAAPVVRKARKTPAPRTMPAAAQVTTALKTSSSKAVLRAQAQALRDAGMSRREVGRRLGIAESTLRGWKV